MASIIPLTVDPEKQSDEKLALLAATGDGGAYAHLVKRYQRKIYHIVRRVVFEHEETEDVVQETFIKVYLNLDRFNPERKFFTWLYQIAMNTAFNNVKKRKRKNNFVSKFTEYSERSSMKLYTPEQDLELKEIADIAEEGLGRLAPEIRTVFVLRVFDDFSYKDIAEVLGISIGTVMSRLSRARSKMRKHLISSGKIKHT